MIPCFNREHYGRSSPAVSTRNVRPTCVPCAPPCRGWSRFLPPASPAQRGRTWGAVGPSGAVPAVRAAAAAP